jgi:hypothetical protein
VVGAGGGQIVHEVHARSLVGGRPRPRDPARLAFEEERGALPPRVAACHVHRLGELDVDMRVADVRLEELESVRTPENDPDLHFAKGGVVEALDQAKKANFSLDCTTSSK